MLDGSVRRIDEGRVLIGGSPMRLLRLTEAGSRLVDRLAAGQEVGSGAGARRLARRLLDRGMAHPRMVPSGRSGRRGHRRDPGLRSDRRARADPRRHRRRRRACPRRSWSSTTVRPETGRRRSSGWHPRPAPGSCCARPRGGPGAARNSGLELVDTPLVAFVDADVEPAPDWLAQLLPALRRPGRGRRRAPRGADGSGADRIRRPCLRAHATDSVVGSPSDRSIGSAGSSSDPPNSSRSPIPCPPWARPSATNRYRIVADGQRADVGAERRWSLAGALDRFERSRSPLDLGRRTGPGRAPDPGGLRPDDHAGRPRRRGPRGRRVRRADGLRRGRRPDLAAGRGRPHRALRAGGHGHPPVRPDLASWLRQRFDYGSSAAPLAARHPEALAPVSVSAWSAAAWTLAATGFPLTGVAVVAVAAAVQLPSRLGRPRAPVAGVPAPGRRRHLGGVASAVVGRHPHLVARRPGRRRSCRAGPAERCVAAALVPPLVDWFARRSAGRPRGLRRPPPARRPRLRRRRLGRLRPRAHHRPARPRPHLLARPPPRRRAPDRPGTGTDRPVRRRGGWTTGRRCR